MYNIIDSLKSQREQILVDNSEEVFSRHTSLLEVAVISLYNRMVNRLNLDTEQLRSTGAILALGHFGKGLVGPNQSLPLLFLKAQSSPWREDWMDEITLPLSEAGWTVEVQQGTVDLLLERVTNDFSFFLDLLEARYISGNRGLSEELEKALQTYMEGRQDALLDALYKSVQARADRLGDPQSWLEPDLDRNPGALSEIAAIRAACRITSNIPNLEDAIFRGFLTRQEVDFLKRAEKTFARLLSLLPAISGKMSSILRTDEQESLAKKLGYSARIGFLPVEAFMQEVFQLVHGVLCVSQDFWERLHETREEGGDERSLEMLESGMVARRGKIHLQTDKYPASAGHLVHLFAQAAKNRLAFDNVTRQWIQHHRNSLDTAAGNIMVKDEFLELLGSDTPELPLLRRFYNQGLFAALVPELTAVHGLVQHDAFHLYPLHEHHLRTLSELKKLLRGDYSNEEPELTQIAQGIADTTCLFLAALLHDIGKSAGEGHALRGAEMIPTIARRLGFGAEECNMVQFLVAEHLLLMDSASMRDLADEEMLAHCALTIESTDKLDRLVLLSFADMAATGPKAFQKWRDTPVIPLYQRIHHLLEKGEPSPLAIAERIEQVRNQVAKEVADLMDRAELESHFARLAPRYLLSMLPSAIARHLRLEWQLEHSGEPFVWEVGVSDGAAELTLMSWEKPGLVSRIAGILTLHDMNIVGAQVFTMHNGVSLLIFQCRLPEGAEKIPDWDAVREDIKQLLQGKIALTYRIAAHAARGGYSQPPVRQTPSQILIDNDSSGTYTILEVYTTDRVGLLYTIARTLFELKVRIYVAKITTKVDQVADVFYIKTYDGEKVTDRKQIEEITSALQFWLDGALGG